MQRILEDSNAHSVSFLSAAPIAARRTLRRLRPCGYRALGRTGIVEQRRGQHHHVLNFGGSLPDGRYVLTVHAGQVTDVPGHILLQDQTYNFFRLFGDYDGNGVVNNADYFRFKSTFGQSSADPVDYDANGIINNADYFQFKKRFATQF